MSSTATAPVTDNQEEKYYRIGEFSKLTGVPPFVLRYWEEELPMLVPLKSPAGYRLYRQQDVELVQKIKRLLHDEGMTLAGVRRHLRDLKNGVGLEAAVEGIASATAVAEGDGEAVHLNRKMLLDLRDALRSFLTLLEGK
ncbi:MAG TPA: MerR family transcriptional regulator [Terriglobales bacterium]|nr:MerR family transcriptional regulator [Terriglobales bacterium]